eukprot:TRINITY_DN10959_c0_g1_i2.p4 TRINITY_DN10959_c0_g1~~TRINITY_DN10959_c0_g1_i2.p4  ORF type:complete len:135 (-),score=12.27 TRINITY_DN10959_c0_g1_i2:7-411(-)
MICGFFFNLELRIFSSLWYLYLWYIFFSSYQCQFLNNKDGMVQQFVNYVLNYSGWRAIYSDGVFDISGKYFLNRCQYCFRAFKKYCVEVYFNFGSFSGGDDKNNQVVEFLIWWVCGDEETFGLNGIINIFNILC